jgi:hypothetical protein
MPNSNNIERLMGSNSPAQGVNAIPSYVPTTTSATVLTNQTGAAAVVNVGGTQYLSAATTAPSFGVAFDGFPFKLRINGKVTTGASCNITVAIQQGNSTTVTAGNTVATTGAIAVNTTSANFQLECVCVWDGVGQKIQGAILPSSWVNATAVAASVLTNSNGVTVTSQSSLTFVPVLTASATTGCTVSITEFVAETV